MMYVIPCSSLEYVIIYELKYISTAALKFMLLQIENWCTTSSQGY